MAEQVGCQSGARVGIHNHSSINQGGLLNLYSPFVGFRVPHRTGALAISCANDTSRNNTSDVSILIKEILINVSQLGNFRIDWQMKNLASAGNVQSQFVVNGIGVGALETMNSNIWTDYLHNYDVNLAVGDRLQIYARRTVAETVFIRNFRIRYDWQIEHFSDGTNRMLVTALPLSDVDLLDFTNTLGY